MDIAMAGRTRKGYLTLLNVISSFAVICLHANGCFWDFSTDRYWFRANIIETVFYFAVPVFFMISGATLVNYTDRYSTKEYAIKRIKKVGIPFIVWSFIGLGYNIARSRVDIAAINLKYLTNGLLNTSIISIYWFFPALICVYMCIPLLAATAKEKRKDVFSYLAVMCFLINCVVPFLNKAFKTGISWPFSISVGSGYLLFVIVGYLLSEYELKRPWKVLVYACALAGLLIHMIGTYKLSMAAGSLVSTYKGYNELPSVLYAIGVFLFFKDYGPKVMDLPVSRLVDSIDKYTFGIYLCHLYVKDMFGDFLVKYFSIPSTSFRYFLIEVPVIIVVSVAIVALLKRIPVIKHIVP